MERMTMSRLERLEERADLGLSVAVMYVCVCVYHKLICVAKQCSLNKNLQTLKLLFSLYEVLMADADMISKATLSWWLIYYKHLNLIDMKSQFSQKY